jgi:transposase
MGQLYLFFRNRCLVVFCFISIAVSNVYAIPPRFYISGASSVCHSNEEMELLPLTGGKRIGRFNESIKFDYMSKRVFDSAFKKMAVELSYARGSVKEAAAELGIDPGRITKWRHQQQGSGEKTITALTEEQKEIRRLQKALKEAQLERDILKKAVSIFSRGDGRYTDS